MVSGERAYWLAKALLAGCWALFMLVGCESGTITGQEQTCRSSGGLFAVEEISCTGSVASARGSPHLTIVEADEEEINVALKVVGKEVRDLRYEATLVRQD